MKGIYFFIREKAKHLATRLDHHFLKENTLRGPGFDSIELAGEKVRLRPTTALDAAPAFRFITGEPDFTRFMAWSGPKSVDELVETYSKRWHALMQSGTSYPLAIEERDRPGIIGCIQLRPAQYPGQYDFGYWLGKPYWNRGYMAEALGLVCYFCFKRLNAYVIVGSAFTGNIGSRRVMEKNGFKFEGVLRREILKDNKWVDLWRLSLLREEWEQHKTLPTFENIVPAVKS